MPNVLTQLQLNTSTGEEAYQLVTDNGTYFFRKSTFARDVLNYLAAESGPVVVDVVSNNADISGELTFGDAAFINFSVGVAGANFSTVSITAKFHQLILNNGASFLNSDSTFTHLSGPTDLVVCSPFDPQSGVRIEGFEIVNTLTINWGSSGNTGLTIADSPVVNTLNLGNGVNGYIDLELGPVANLNLTGFVDTLVLGASACVFTTAQVDAILARALADGLTTGSINLGGTNAPAGPQGQADAAQLVLDGVTVTINT
jgi:hypothetical protein